MQNVDYELLFHVQLRANDELIICSSMTAMHLHYCWHYCIHVNVRPTRDA